jgi:hypothetical protein
MNASAATTSARPHGGGESGPPGSGHAPTGEKSGWAVGFATAGVERYGMSAP